MSWNKSSLTLSTISLSQYNSSVFGCLIIRLRVMPCWTWLSCVMSYLALMRYWATLMLAGEPVIVTWRMAEPSVALAILM